MPAPVANLPPGLQAIDIAPDGRFLILQNAHTAAETVDVVLNWGANLGGSPGQVRKDSMNSGAGPPARVRPH